MDSQESSPIPQFFVAQPSLYLLQNRKRLIAIEKKPMVTNRERGEEESIRSFRLTEAH